MHPQEFKISPLSDYYVYTPSSLARKLYLYPLSIGHFIYSPGYELRRNSFDSFLLMHIISGSLDVVSNGNTFSAGAGDFLLLDCYLPHQYGSSTGWEASWMHFDGPLAREYFHEITSHSGCVLTPVNSKTISRTLDGIRTLFKNAEPVIESVLSSQITAALNELLIPVRESRKFSPHSAIVADSVAFINEHFHEQLSLHEIAAKANLSPYHFSRIFTREIGFTPHQYLISTRISAAKFMLKSSESSIKDIAFCTGFRSESSFCTTFKKWLGVTPSQYRADIPL